jgi:hypothetical protein
VAHILVIELGWTGAFIRSSQRLVVPVLNNIDAVRVERWNEKNDRVAENLLNFGFI